MCNPMARNTAAGYSCSTRMAGVRSWRVSSATATASSNSGASSTLRRTR